MIILKVTNKKQCLTLSSEDTFFEERRGGQIDPPSCFRVKTVTLYNYLTTPHKLR